MLRPREIGALLFGLLFQVGCRAGALGDPCVPDIIPEGGFRSGENIIEVNSPQCRSNTCIVFRLEGDPSHVLGERSCTGNPNEHCVDRNLPITNSSSLERAFCSCRCAGSSNGENVGFPLCECTFGFHCIDVADVGAPNVRGGYCVPNELCERDEDCASGRCNLADHVCDLAGA